MDLDVIATLIVSLVTSGSLFSLLNWRTQKRKAEAEAERLRAEAELAGAEAGEKHTQADNQTIGQLISVNNLYATRMEALDAKVTELEKRELARRNMEVDLEIRVKRLEAELAITVQTVRNRDETIAQLELALEECRAIVSSQSQANMGEFIGE